MGMRRAHMLLVCGIWASSALAERVTPAEATAAPCVGVTQSATPADAHAPTDKGFSARRVLDVNFHVELAPGSTADSLKLELFTPNGHLFQRLDVPIAAAGSAEKERSLPGYPFPVKVATRRASATGASIVDTPPLAVAGTDIVASSLYGRWRVEAWVAGAATACSAEFNILQ